MNLGTGWEKRITRDVQPEGEKCGGEEALLGEGLHLSVRVTETNK